jgi:hypothetical protein
MNKSDAIVCPGAKKAIDEYFAGKPYKIERDSQYGKYFLVKH